MREQIIQILMGMLGTFGFSLLFHLRWRKIVWVVLAAGFSWATYLLAMHFSEQVWVATLLATCTAGVASFIFARTMKAPFIVFVVPILVPLIPGGDLYRTTYHLVMGNGELFRHQATVLAEESGAMAFGIILVSCLTHVPFRIHKNFRAKGKTE